MKVVNGRDFDYTGLHSIAHVDDVIKLHLFWLKALQRMQAWSLHGGEEEVLVKKTGATLVIWTWSGFKESNVEQKNNPQNTPGKINSEERECK